MSYEALALKGLQGVPSDVKANLVKLNFKERDSQNIICNVLQVP